MDAKTYRHRTDFPLLASASDALLLDIALSLLPASVLEEALRRQINQEQESVVTRLIEQLSFDHLQQAQTVLFPKTALKTRPIIARSTGRVFRVQGRPPKDAEPIYVDTEEEALILLSQN